MNIIHLILSCSYTDGFSYQENLLPKYHKKAGNQVSIITNCDIIDVNGKDAHPIFNYLKEQAPTEEHKGLKAKAAAAMFNKISKSVEKDSDIKWNFTKFLISRDGTKVERFAPTTEPKDIESAIEAML